MRPNTNTQNKLAVLTQEYHTWLNEQKLELGSANEHHHDSRLTEQQRKWLRNFSKRWEATAYPYWWRKLLPRLRRWILHLVIPTAYKEAMLEGIRCARAHHSSAVTSCEIVGSNDLACYHRHMLRDLASARAMLNYGELTQ